MIFNKKIRDRNENKILLTEYEVLSDRIEDIVQIYWQAGSIFIGASITGIAIVGQFIIDGDRKLPSIIVFIISIVFISIMTRWGDAADRWNSIVKIFYVRIREIEAILGFWGNRYIDWVDHVGDEEYAFKGIVKEDSDRGRNIIKNYYEGSVRNFRDDIVTVVSIGWFLLLLVSIFIDIIYPKDFTCFTVTEDILIEIRKISLLQTIYICTELFILVWVIINTRRQNKKTTNIGTLSFIALIFFVTALIYVLGLDLFINYDTRVYLLFFVIPISYILKMSYGKIRKIRDKNNWLKKIFS